jgi:hypothetical protein
VYFTQENSMQSQLQATFSPVASRLIQKKQAVAAGQPKQQLPLDRKLVEQVAGGSTDPCHWVMILLSL